MDAVSGNSRHREAGIAKDLPELARRFAENPAAMILTAVALGFLAGLVLTSLEGRARKK